MATLYGGRWKITGDIRAGGQSRVFRVVDTTGELPGEFALKRILNPARSERFIAEIEAIKRLNHPNVIRLVDHSALDAGPDHKQYLVMPLMREDLSRRVELYKGSIDTTLKVVRQICEGVAAAHAQSIIHRDIKPENILFTGGGHEIVISDFGICLLRDVVRVTEINEVVGPRDFTAPELEDGGRLDVTEAADVYSIGKVIYYMLTGGTVLPRERLADPEYSSVFSNGERYTMLRALLSRMICSYDSRCTDIKEVISALTSLEEWENRATAHALSASARTSLDQLKNATMQKQATEAAEAATQAQLRESISTTIAACRAWLLATLEGVAKELNAPGVLESDVSSSDKVNMGVIGGAGNVRFSPAGAVELKVRQVTAGSIWHGIQFVICNVVRFEFRYGNSPPTTPPRPPEIVVVPFYRVFQTGSGGNGVFIARKGFRSPQDRAFVNGFTDVRTNLCCLFPLTQLHAATEQLQLTVQESVDVLIDHLQRLTS